MSAAVPPDIPGLVYVQPVGSGGYADVFLYEQQMPRMPVAVKVPSALVRASPPAPFTESKKLTWHSPPGACPESRTLPLSVPIATGGGPEPPQPAERVPTSRPVARSFDVRALTMAASG